MDPLDMEVQKVRNDDPTRVSKGILHRDHCLDGPKGTTRPRLTPSNPLNTLRTLPTVGPAAPSFSRSISIRYERANSVSGVQSLPVRSGYCCCGCTVGLPGLP
jgi:hypothetical protein